MKAGYRKRFLKQLAHLPPVTRSQVERFAFEEIPAAQTVGDLGRIEKLKGYRNAYKRRFGSFRVGMKVEGDALVLVLVMDRKDIYRYFP